MNRLWNRDVIHGVAGQITAWLGDEFVRDADVTIDFHCLQAEEPMIFNWHEESVPLAGCFGIEAIYLRSGGGRFQQGQPGLSGRDARPPCLLRRVLPAA